MTPSRAALARRRPHLAVSATPGLRKKTPTRKRSRRHVREGVLGRLSAPAERQRCRSERPTRLRADGREASGAKGTSERSGVHRGDSVRERAGSRTERSGLSPTRERSRGTMDGRDVEAAAGRDGDESGAGRRDVRSERKNGHEGDLEGERPRKDRPANARTRQAQVQTVLRSKASGDRFPDDTAEAAELETALANRSRIGGKGKSEEARVHGDAHRLQGRRVLRGERDRCGDGSRRVTSGERAQSHANALGAGDTGWRQ